MLKHMRTTINLPDGLLAQAKKEAADSGSTLTELIAEAIRGLLVRRRNAPHQGMEAIPVSLTTRGTQGLQPGVDLDDTSSLLDIMDGLDDSGRR
jgi:hypothetical protein